MKDVKRIPKPYISKGRSFHFQSKWFTEHSWIEIDENEKARCAMCVKATTMGLFPSGFSTQPAFTADGFGNWKKGANRLEVHEKSEQHLIAFKKLANLESKSPNITEQLSYQLKQNQEAARKCLSAMFSSIKYLTKQGIAIRGHDDDGGNYIELLKLRQNDIKELETWLNRKKHLTSHDIQNEMIDILAKSVLRKIVGDIQKNGIFSLIVDETRDISNREQVAICIRSVDSDLRPKEYFIGLYETSNTTGEVLSKLILDALQRLGLDITNLRGQCYDGAACMSGKYSGVQAKLLSLERRAIFVHCKNHGLNLALQDVVKTIPMIRDTLQWTNDVGVLIHRSPKRYRNLRNLPKQVH